MSDFRERVVAEVINNNVPVSKYSAEEQICDLELAVERGEQRIHELEAFLKLAESSMDVDCIDNYNQITGREVIE